MAAFLFVVAAYLCGSLPVGVWAGRWVGVDVRRVGSGNIGTTNVARSAGPLPAVLTLAGDVLKGFLPVLVARAILQSDWLVCLVGLAAFFGHVYSVFLRFSGGKGVATAFGVFLALAPGAAGLSAAVFAAAALATRYASVASLLAAVILPVAVAALGYAAPFGVGALVAAAVIVFRHRDNLSRLRRGAEPQFHFGGRK